MQTSSSQPLAGCFEGHHWSSKSYSYKTSQGTPKRMADNPDVGFRIHICQVIIKVLRIVRMDRDRCKGVLTVPIG